MLFQLYRKRMEQRSRNSNSVAVSGHLTDLSEVKVSFKGIEEELSFNFISISLI